MYYCITWSSVSRLDRFHRGWQGSSRILGSIGLCSRPASGANIRRSFPFSFAKSPRPSRLVEIGSGWYVHKQASADLLLRSFPTLCVYVYKERNQLCWLIKKRNCLLDWYCIHVLLPIQQGEREHTGPNLFASAGHVQKETRSSDWPRTPIGDWSFCCCTDRCWIALLLLLLRTV